MGGGWVGGRGVDRGRKSEKFSCLPFLSISVCQVWDRKNYFTKSNDFKRDNYNINIFDTHKVILKNTENNVTVVIEYKISL